MSLSSYSVQSDRKRVHSSGWISSILSKAVAFWLQSQVESVEQLEVLIEAKHQDLLRGRIPQVTLKAAHGIYQGLHLSQIDLTTTQILTNLSQVLKGKPLQLLEPIDVVCQLTITQADLDASVSVPLLANALRDILLPWLQSEVEMQSITDLSIQYITLSAPNFIINGIVICESKCYPFQLQTQLQIHSTQILAFTEPLLTIEPIMMAKNLEDYLLDLGSSVKIQPIILESDSIGLQGQIQVNPAC
ncbi:MAG: DUF2993 domain-containing protein [Microcoleaceae cyanobacterium]